MGVTVVHSLGHLIVPVVKFPFVPPKQSSRCSLWGDFPEVAPLHASLCVHRVCMPL